MVQASAQWLHTVSAVDIPTRQVDVATLLADVLGSLEDRQIRIIEGRLLKDPVETLDSVGQDLGITRERVRQLMGRLQAETTSWLSGDSELGHAAAGVRYQLNPITPLSTLLDQNYHLKSTIDAVGRPAWYLLDKLDDEFESDGTWVAKPSLEAVGDKTRVLFADYANTFGAATITDTLEAFSGWTTMQPDDIAQWLMSLGFSFVLDYVFAPEVRSIPERAAAYLSMVNVPQSPETIHAAVCPDKNLAGLRNQLTGAPETFMRTGRSTYGLVEWGMRQYTTVRDAIGQLIDESDGTVALDDVIHDLSSSFGLAPGSVAQYAHAWPYEVVEGAVRRAAAPPQSNRTRTIAEIRNVYHHENGVMFRTYVTPDHLRGSGTNVSAGLAHAIGVWQGQITDYANDLQPIKVSWTGLQPSIGSTRQFMTTFDAAVGSLLRVVFSADGRADVTLVRDPESLDAVGLVGAVLDLEHPTYSAIAHRLGISSNSSRADVLKAVRSRGETDLADILADPRTSLDK